MTNFVGHVVTTIIVEPVQHVSTARTSMDGHYVMSIARDPLHAEHQGTRFWASRCSRCGAVIATGEPPAPLVPYAWFPPRASRRELRIGDICVLVQLDSHRDVRTALLISSRPTVNAFGNVPANLRRC